MKERVSDKEAAGLTGLAEIRVQTYMRLRRDQSRAASMGARPTVPSRTQNYLASSSWSQRRSGTVQRPPRPAKPPVHMQDAGQSSGPVPGASISDEGRRHFHTSGYSHPTSSAVIRSQTNTEYDHQHQQESVPDVSHMISSAHSARNAGNHNSFNMASSYGLRSLHQDSQREMSNSMIAGTFRGHGDVGFENPFPSEVADGEGASVQEHPATIDRSLAHRNFSNPTSDSFRSSSFSDLVPNSTSNPSSANPPSYFPQQNNSLPQEFNSNSAMAPPPLPFHATPQNFLPNDRSPNNPTMSARMYLEDVLDAINAQLDGQHAAIAPGMNAREGSRRQGLRLADGQTMTNEQRSAIERHRLAELSAPVTIGGGPQANPQGGRHVSPYTSLPPPGTAGTLSSYNPAYPQAMGGNVQISRQSLGNPTQYGPPYGQMNSNGYPHIAPYAKPVVTSGQSGYANPYINGPAINPSSAAGGATVYTNRPINLVSIVPQYYPPRGQVNTGSSLPASFPANSQPAPGNPFYNPALSTGYGQTNIGQPRGNYAQPVNQTQQFSTVRQGSMAPNPYGNVSPYPINIQGQLQQYKSGYGGPPSMVYAPPSQSRIPGPDIDHRLIDPALFQPYNPPPPRRNSAPTYDEWYSPEAVEAMLASGRGAVHGYTLEDARLISWHLNMKTFPNFESQSRYRTAMQEIVRNGVDYAARSYAQATLDDLDIKLRR